MSGLTTSPPQATHPLVDPPFGADWWYRVQVPAQPWAVGLVRSSLLNALARHGWQAHTDVVSLLASELVTNGIVHGRHPVSVSLSGRAEVLRLDVYDPGPGLPRRRQATGSQENGRGLALLAALADRWGAMRHPTAGGKSVWCEVDHRSTVG